MEKIEIDIVTHPKFQLWRYLLSLVTMILPISIGILTGSVAMQWMGFVMSLVLIMIIGFALGKPNKELTIEEARARLDELAKDEWR